MNDDLVANLQALRRDPAVVVNLYKQLFNARLVALVTDPTVPLKSLSFLTYPTPDGIRELPVFTSGERTILSRLEADGGARRVELDGTGFWLRMLDVVRTGECEVAVDAGEEYGIRITREILLGMVNQYGSGIDDSAAV